MNKRIQILICCLFLGLSVSWAEKVIEKVPSAVTSYYNNMMLLRQSSANDRAFLQRKMTEAFAGGGEGALLPNDLKVCGVTTSDCGIQSIYDPALRPSTYIMALRNLADQMQVKVDYLLGKSEYLSGGVEYKKGEAPPSFVRSVVQKMYIIKNKSYVFVDTVMFALKTNTISYIHNNCIPIQYSNSNSIETLTARATELYHSKRHREAFELYEKILIIEPKNQNANYSIALMYYRRKGCKQLSLNKREMDKRAWQHMSNAQFGRDWDMGKRATRILKNWTKGGGGM